MKKWYIIHTYSGYENKVKEALEERIKAFHSEDYFGNILVPSEKVVDLIKGEKKTTDRKLFPSYILVNMELNEETWHLVKNTPKVTRFIGEGFKPLPISEEDVEKIEGQVREGILHPKPKVRFEKGDNVMITDGPFSNFSGIVDEVKAEKGRVRVLISIFGRPTPMDLDFLQVKKV